MSSNTVVLLWVTIASISRVLWRRSPWLTEMPLEIATVFPIPVVDVGERVARVSGGYVLLVVAD